jgi:hypothetical protein
MPNENLTETTTANLKKSPYARPGNNHAEKHGGAGALQKIQRGEPFTGLAVEAERQVKADLLDVGAAGMVKQQAIRLQTVASCYYGAILACQNVEEMAALIKVWGWVANSALRAWQAVEVAEKNAGKGVSIVDVLQSIRGDTDANSK